MATNSNQFILKYEKTQAAPNKKLFLLNIFDWFKEWEDHPHFKNTNKAIRDEEKENARVYNQKKGPRKTILKKNGPNTRFTVN